MKRMVAVLLAVAMLISLAACGSGKTQTDPNRLVIWHDKEDAVIETLSAYLKEALPDVEIMHVPGNCDFASIAQPSIFTELGGVRIFMTHGHLFGVKRDTKLLLQQSRLLGAQIALFGHTHCALCECCDGVWLLNPGACGRFRCASYGVIEIEAGGRFSCRIEDFD